MFLHLYKCSICCYAFACVCGVLATLLLDVFTELLSLCLCLSAACCYLGVDVLFCVMLLCVYYCVLWFRCVVLLLCVFAYLCLPVLVVWAFLFYAMSL